MKKVIDFDVEKAKSGEYQVVTKDGRPVRIICWDKIDGGNYCIVALIRNKVGNEITMTYRENGLSNDHFRDDSIDLHLEVDVEPSELLTDFEYKVGSSMYGSYIDEMNEEGLACVKATARELLDLAKMELFNEAWFDSVNNDENEILRSNISESRISDNLRMILLEKGWDVIDTKNNLAALKAILKHGLSNKWFDSDKCGISNVRYTVQDDVIYDCVAGKDVYIKNVLEIVEKALNYEETNDEEKLKRSRERVERVGRIKKRIRESLTTSKVECRTSNRVGL